MQQLTDWATKQDEERESLRTDIFAQVSATIEDAERVADKYKPSTTVYLNHSTTLSWVSLEQFDSLSRTYNRSFPMKMTYVCTCEWLVNAILLLSCSLLLLLSEILGVLRTNSAKILTWSLLRACF